MFAVGEYVYYASEGVCHVADICCAPLCGMPADRIYYVLHPFRNNGRGAVCANRQRERFSAPPADGRGGEPSAERDPCNGGVRRTECKGVAPAVYRSHAYPHALRMGAVIKTVRERVSRIRGSSRAQRISETERGFAEDAKRYLYAELSLALDVPVGEMEQYIRNRIETCSA